MGKPLWLRAVQLAKILFSVFEAFSFLLDDEWRLDRQQTKRVGKNQNIVMLLNEKSMLRLP